MKHIIHNLYIFILAVIVMLFSACVDNFGETDYVYSTIPRYLRSNTSSLKFDGTGASEYLYIYSLNTDWSISGASDWLSIKEEENPYFHSYSYDGSVCKHLKVTASENGPTTDRSCILTIKSDDPDYPRTFQIKVTQSKVYYVNLSEENVQFSHEGGTKTITLDTNIEDFTISSSDSSWLEVTLSSDSNLILLKALPNFSDRSRTAQVNLNKDGSELATVLVNQPRNYAETAYVDLALPSGTLWATCNVGADTPEEYGLYFAWGETIGYTGDTSSSHIFDWTNYKWCNGSSMSLTKYCKSSSYGVVDNKTVLDSEDDAATVYWGNSWCMPTYEQISELINSSYTTITTVTQNGVSGELITSKGNGNTLFLPEAGYYNNIYHNSYSRCYYWSKSLYYTTSSNSAYVINDTYTGSLNRYYGCSIRPVRVQE